MAEMTPEQHRPPPAPPAADPPGSWWLARRVAQKALAPVERFLAVEAASGIVLLAATALALGWANSPLRDSYEALWHLPVGVRLGPFVFERSLHFWVNDGLMTIFFFVVGLEIRREMHGGELSEWRRAALPLAAALGGMLVPAALFLALNHGRASADGWGIPMATDIAFALGVLALLGKRVLPALRILLLALAVIDDVGAILVIAIFYSSGLAVAGLLVLLGGVVAIGALQLFGVRSPLAYVLPAFVIWAGAYASGIHPTLAGVVVGLLTPVRAWFGPSIFVEHAGASVARLRDHAEQQPAEHAVLEELGPLDRARREVVSPVESLQHVLHGPVAYGIMPLFALANAGVPLGKASFDGDAGLVFAGVTLGLVLGKPLGILAFSWLSVRARVAALPNGVGFSQVALVGLVGGIGFTMALFIGALAYPPGAFMETAKLAVLVASGLAALAAALLGRVLLPAARTLGAASSAAQAESSTAM